MHETYQGDAKNDIASRCFISNNGSINHLLKDVVLMRALRDMNLPKFVFEDVPLFLGLIADLFPGLDCPRVRYPNFNDAVEEAIQDNKYILLPQQVCYITENYSIGFKAEASRHQLILRLLSISDTLPFWPHICKCHDY